MTVPNNPNTPTVATAYCPECDRTITIKDGVYRRHPSKDMTQSCPNSGQAPVAP